MEKDQIVSILQKLSEAAFVPETWVKLMDDLVATTQGDTARLQIYWPNPKGIYATPGELVETKSDLNSLAKDRKILIDYIDEHKISGFERYHDYYRDFPKLDEMNDYRVTRGVGFQCLSIFELFNGEKILLELKKKLGRVDFSDSDIQCLNFVHKNIERSLLLASRLYFEQAKGSVDTLGRINIPGALLDDRGRILHSNAQFDELDNLFLSLPGERIAIIGGSKGTILDSNSLGAEQPSDVTLVLPQGDDHSGFVLHVMTLHGLARDIFESSYRILVATPVSQTRNLPSVDILSRLFSLTPAEARLALSVASGLSLRDSAAKSQISVGTARSYLLRVFSKTRTNSQSQLVSLIKSVPFT